MNAEFYVAAIVYAFVFGGICYALAERKGMTGGNAFGLGFLLGIFGLIYLMLQRDVPRGWTPPPEVPKASNDGPAFSPLLVGAFLVAVIAVAFLASR